MTAVLAPPITENFLHAVDFDAFFKQADKANIRNVLEKRERPPVGVPRESCNTNLFFGFFFDGTRNNYINDAPPKNSHSNVARLYDCYPGLSVPGVLPGSTDWKDPHKRYTHFFRVYVPGVGSPFSKVNDSGEGLDAMFGGAGGVFGERRIIWALLQAINNVHRFFLQAPLLTQPEIERLLRVVVLTKLSRSFMQAKGDADIPGRVEWRARGEFGKVLARLHDAVRLHWPAERTGKVQKINPGVVKTIYISTFGFSRGATEARVFNNWLQSLCKLDALLVGSDDVMSLGGFKVEFDFLGLFDTVASVGLANSSRLYDGHAAWADAEDSLRVPPGVKCLHLVAAHELRRSFPVDSISVKGSISAGCDEIVVPGVHSDVGGGYSPREQGRGSDLNGDDMLSRIPLLMMYRAARLNGAPLKLEMADSTVQKRFTLRAETIRAFNAYISTCKETQGPIHAIMREQARRQMEWRLARRIAGRTSLQTTASYRRASSFHKNDLYSAAMEFETEIAEFESWLKAKGAGFRPASQPIGFSGDRYAEWEEIASWWKKGMAPGAEILNFFDDYVHDSRASFKLTGPENEEEMHKQLRGWVKMSETTVPVLAGKADYKSANAGLSADQRRLAAAYVRTGEIPQMNISGREPNLLGAGYLRFRRIYGGWDKDLLS